jgi:hypothetical protein
MPPGGAPRERGRQYKSHQHHQNRMHGQNRVHGPLMLIMTIGLLPGAVKPGFHCV